MANYRSYGSLDDQHLLDGDAGFIGMNQREQPNQLQPGEVVLSQNGRIDGFWQPRRGITLKSGALSNSALPLKIPFAVIDSSIAISTASRTSNVVTINLAAAHNIDPGTVAYVTLGDPDVATEPITGIMAGAYLMTYVDADSLSFANTGADDPTLTIHGTYGYIATTIDNDAVSVIHGSCRWSDPSSSLLESIILASTNEAKRVRLDTYAVSAIPYPSGVTVDGSCDMIQAFDRIFLFQEGQRAWEYIPNGRPVEAGSYVSATGVVTLTLKQHGFTTGDTVTVANVGFSAVPTTADPNGTHVITSTPSADTFTYVIATGSGDETYTANTGTATSSGFSLCAGGPFTQPQSFNIAGNKYGVSSGIVRFTVVGNTTIRAGNWITVDDTEVPELQPLIGNTYQVTSANSTDIYFAAPVGDYTYASGSAADYIEFSGRFSAGGGFIHMPAPPWGLYFQRRLWVPYWFSNGGTTAAPTYTDRELRDEICASDILDSNTYDAVSNQFRITAGIADHLVAMHPFYDDSVLVLNRNSLHIVAGTQGSLGDTVVRELTREVGCLARKSVVSQGNNIFFLSDNGVYGLSFIDQYNLRGVEEPLSLKIQPYIDRINKGRAASSVGIYFNNRYYLAVPLDSQVGANDAYGNNSVLIYNMLNKAWESIDTYGASFNIIGFELGQAGERNALYIVNDQGGLHLTDDSDDARDTYSLNVTGASTTEGIDYQLTTRGYTGNTLERKRFVSAQVQMRSSQDSASDVDFRFSSEDPDTADFLVTDIATMLDPAQGMPGQLPADETGNFRFRLGGPRGIYGALTIKRKIVGSEALGRPKVTSVALTATKTNRQTLTQY